MHHTMNRSLTLLTGFALATGLCAQCEFTPTISPSDLVLCPLEAAMLSTQAYDSYQWYKEGQPIPGAVGQTLPVDYQQSSGYSFSVLAELDGCAEMSPPVLVDGWVFLPPVVMTEGDEPLGFTGEGVAQYCEGAFVQLTLGMPYTESIEWTRNGQPIQGADAPVLVVTESGSYHVSGAPAICPDYVVGLGVTVDIEFVPPTQPVISAVDGELCAAPPGPAYAWYLNGVELANSNQSCIVPVAPGSYTVSVAYANGCHVPSEPYLSTSLDEAPPRRLPTVLVLATMLRVDWTGTLSAGAAWHITDAQGRLVRTGTLPAEGPSWVDMTGAGDGLYFLRILDGGRGAPSAATRFTWHR